MSTYPHFGTNAIHVGQDPEQWNCKALVPPIFTTTTYKQDEPGKPPMHDYIREGNPTRTALEKSVAACEGAQYAHTFSSGMAAVSTVMQALLKSGDHIVSVNDVYGGVNRFFRKVASGFNISVTLVDATNTSNVENAIKDNTKVIWMESPTNPTLTVIDIAVVSDIAHKKGCTAVVDNTFLTPYFQRPLSLGADLVLHSMTKYLNGHCDVLMGALCTNNKEIHEKLKFLQLAVGAVPSPFDCYLANRGLRTLHVRMRAHAENALAVAKYLEGSPLVENAIYPGLPSHPQHELAKKQAKGFGGMVSFRIKGESKNAKAFIKNLKIFTLAESLGGVESLAEIPSLMTHLSVPPEERAVLGITDTLIRLSVGLEDAEDLIADIEQALKVMSLTHHGVYEYELESHFEQHCRLEGAQRLAFVPVVAGGDRGCHLHYTTNELKLRDGQLVLLDAGAEYHGYVSDVTRTWPVNGRFTEAQRDLYEAVLRVKEECIKSCQVGVTLNYLHSVSRTLLVDELKKLNILPYNLNGSDLLPVLNSLYPHDLGHYLGMDVHDTPLLSHNVTLQPGMVVTIEPGVYIRRDFPIQDPTKAKEFQGLAVRIEDDVLVTSSGPQILNEGTPQTIEDITSLINNS